MKTAKKSDFVEQIAFDIVAFIASEEASFTSFLNTTGSSIEDLKQSIEQPETHAALLDFLLEQEPLLLQFCEKMSYQPDDIWKARKRLPGFATWDSM